MNLLRIGMVFSAVLPLTAQVPPPFAAGIHVTVKEGDGALNNIKASRAWEPVVIVSDNDGRPMAGVQVMFLVPDVGASATFPASGNVLVVTTKQDGLAIARGMKPNNVSGPFEIRVSASYQGQTARAVLRQTNASPGASIARSRKGGKTALVLALIGGAGAGVAYAVTRPGASTGATAPGASVTAGGTIFGPPR